MNWTPGPARCRSDEYEAEIAFTDMPGDYPLHGRARRRGHDWYTTGWRSDGRRGEDDLWRDDLMPPTITREALADECVNKFGWPQPLSVNQQAMAIVAHVIDAVKAGRVE